MLSVLRLLRDGRPLRAPEHPSEAASQHLLRLGKVRQKVGPKTSEPVRLQSIDLDQAEVLDVWRVTRPERRRSRRGRGQGWEKVLATL